MEDTRTALLKAGIPCRILGRDKTIYGIYNKMREKHQSFSDALDIYGFRLVVKILTTAISRLEPFIAVSNPFIRALRTLLPS